MKTKTTTTVDYPVPGFPIRYEWQTNHWQTIFDKQVELIRQDLRRARAARKMIIYLSCPISSRGGGNHETNVDIALHTERQLMQNWGDSFWFLNPVRYQMESKEGTGLLQQHMKALAITASEMAQLPKPSGGDYMRMWTKVLVEDNRNNTGGYFDGYYFLGPKDVHHFFAKEGGSTLTVNVESYLARKSEIEVENINHFLRFYALRASAAFSLGCHDEWNIFCKLNQARLKHNPDLGELLAGYFDGEQVALDISETRIGYEKE